CNWTFAGPPLRRGHDTGTGNIGARVRAGAVGRVRVGRRDPAAAEEGTLRLRGGAPVRPVDQPPAARAMRRGAQAARRGKRL
ncbi:MAG: hypothetical protein AVDCRST_MAG91-2840, partial [uncultured Sphingomonadaceae bacterium]